MVTTLNDVRRFIQEQATRDDLNSLADSFKIRRNILNSQASLNINRNDKVKFDTGRRGIVKGIVSGFTRSGKVEVASTTGIRWKVSASICEPWDGQ